MVFDGRYEVFLADIVESKAIYYQFRYRFIVKKQAENVVVSFSGEAWMRWFWYRSPSFIGKRSPRFGLGCRFRGSARLSSKISLLARKVKVKVKGCIITKLFWVWFVQFVRVWLWKIESIISASWRSLCWWMSSNAWWLICVAVVSVCSTGARDTTITERYWLVLTGFFWF